MIAEDELVSLNRPNGCGKTTAQRTIACLLFFSGGEEGFNGVTALTARYDKLMDVSFEALDAVTCEHIDVPPQKTRNLRDLFVAFVTQPIDEAICHIDRKVLSGMPGHAFEKQTDDLQRPQGDDGGLSASEFMELRTTTGQVVLTEVEISEASA